MRKLIYIFFLLLLSTSCCYAGVETEKLALTEDSVPTNKADTGYLFTQDDSGSTELYYEDHTGNVVQLTREGIIDAHDIHDTDNDTKIQAEESADEDILRFDTAGSERMQIDASGDIIWVNDMYTVAGRIHLNYDGAHDDSGIYFPSAGGTYANYMKMIVDGDYIEISEDLHVWSSLTVASGNPSGYLDCQTYGLFGEGVRLEGDSDLYFGYNETVDRNHLIYFNDSSDNDDVFFGYLGGEDIFTFSSDPVRVTNELTVVGVSGIAGAENVVTSGSSTTVTTSNNDFATVETGAIITANSVKRQVKTKVSTNQVTLFTAVDWDNGGVGYSYTYENPVQKWTNSSDVLIGYIDALGRYRMVLTEDSVDAAFKIYNEGDFGGYYGKAIDFEISPFTGFAIDWNGHFGINTRSPSHSIQIYDQAAGFVYNDGSNTYFELNNNAGSMNIPDFTFWNTTVMTEDLTIDSPTFFVDASENKVGVGTITPDTVLHVTVPDATAVLRLERNDTTVSSSDIVARIEVETQDASASGVCASIEALSYDDASAVGWRFKTGTPSDLVEAMQIDNNGQVGIGTPYPDSPGANLEVKYVTGAFTRLSRYDTEVAADDIIGCLEFHTNDTGNAGIGAYIRGIGEGSSGEMGLSFATGTSPTATEAIRIDETGKVGIGTTGPSQRLEVAGNVLLSSNGVVQGDRQTIYLIIDGTNLNADRYLTLSYKPSSATYGFYTPRAGSIISISAALEVDATGGAGRTLVIYSRVNGTNKLATNSINTATTGDKGGYATAARGTHTFTAGQWISCYGDITGTQTINPVDVWIEVVYDT